MNIKLHELDARFRSLILFSLIFTSTYLIFVRTDLGQRFDDAAYLGRYEISKEERVDFGKLLDLVNKSSLALMFLVLFGYVLVTKKLKSGLEVLATFTVAVVCAEAFKRLLDRPEVDYLEELVKDGGLNTFPSGHSTIATSLVAGLFILSSKRWRSLTIVLGTSWVIVMTVGTLIAGWHRPSDAIGGIALSVALFSFFNPSKIDVDLSRSSRQIKFIWVIALSLFFASLAMGLQDNLHSSISPWIFPIAAIAIITFASLALADFYHRNSLKSELANT